jgi:hypothetical protein
MNHITRLAISCVVVLNSVAVQAQQQSPDVLLAAQREQLKPLEMMDGIWRGNAWTILPGGEKIEMVQTERVGSMTVMESLCLTHSPQSLTTRQKGKS